MYHKLAGTRISIDYNDTFSTSRGKELAQRLKNEGNDVYIVTGLNERNRSIVEKAAKGIVAPDHIYFTNGQSKLKTLKELKIKKHYDNNPNVIKDINDNLAFTVGIKF
jgi:DNA-directed RNA polymerase specialized sigma54-like protein